ncbi:MAG: hypothetical protein DA405_08855 [Bacteroidetes bacterium]|nr:MAG: hypothetical protein DA405_08855 [Bacteroidota bacterium]
MASEEFVRVATGDIKSTINNMLSLSEYINETESDLSKEGPKLLFRISALAKNLRQLTEGFLRLSRSSELLHRERSTIDLPQFIASLLNMLDLSAKIVLSVDIKVEKIFRNEIASEQILLIKFTQVAKRKIAYA